MSKVRLEFFHGKDSRIAYGRKVEEFIADFCLISRRTLTPFEYDIFRFHFLLGADWKLCCRQQQIDRGTFFHTVYRIEQKLGRVFRELEPYGLFPLDEYFGGVMRNDLTAEYRAAVESVRVCPMRVLRPPIGLSAA
jgi:hypothetical protein